MPGLVRKILISAAADGLFLGPAGARDQEGKGVKITYGAGTITSAARNESDKGETKPLEAHGIVGVLDLGSSSYLITITRREQVAQIRGSAIYAVKDVTLIPLASRAEAERAIASAQKVLKQSKEEVHGEETEESDVGEDADPPSHTEQPPEAVALEPPTGNVLQKSVSIVKDVVQDRGKYGRFAESWFSKGGWTASGRRSQGMTSDEHLTKEQKKQTVEALPESDRDAAPGAETKPDQHQEERKPDTPTQPSRRQNALESLTPRILRSARLYLSSGGFFFSYEHDLSTALTKTDSTSSPLWKRFDALYFWNQHLHRHFIDGGQDAFVLPLLQGFVGQRAFSIARTGSTEQQESSAVAPQAEVVAAQGSPDPTKSSAEGDGQEDYLITLISRRSVKRAGLRYLRRGIDDEGNVANSVETEQILSPQSWDTSGKTFSLLQYRGSIPLFFSQSPYSFKPLPLMFGSETTNQTAFQKHFDKITRRYGSVQCASLVDKHATEASIGQAYEHHAKLLNDGGGADNKHIGFEWFDFHSACKGMKFENVSILMDTLESQLKSFGWAATQDDRNLRQQTGVLRTNCMDCLDRTNVVQSAVAGWALQQQLAELGLNIDLKSDPKTQWFNTLWADNGDAISKQYAGTSALKGDFTRTRKRNWTGALSDFSLTLNRYYNNIFGDYFLQLNIDFYLGNVGPSAFDNFESDMMGKDYALDMGRIRQNAIDSCVKIVLEDPREDLLAAWTLSCPHEANTLRSLPFEECVLLLTDAALYFCRFDWDAEKVGSFERVELLDIIEIWRGAYITNTLGPTHTDEAKNAGFALRYKTSSQSVVRTNTRALQNEKAVEDESSDKAEIQQQDQPRNIESRLLAFKILPPSSSAAKNEDKEAGMSEQELAQHICNELHKSMISAARTQRGFDHLELEKLPGVEEKDVISVADARKSTGYVESIGYTLKKLVWS